MRLSVRMTIVLGSAAFGSGAAWYGIALHGIAGMSAWEWIPYPREHIRVRLSQLRCGHLPIRAFRSPEASDAASSAFNVP